MEKNERGQTLILILIAVLGLIFFLIATNALQFKDALFNTLYPRQESLAAGSETIGKMKLQDIEVEVNGESIIISWLSNLPSTTQIIVGVSKDAFPLTSINDSNLTLDHQTGMTGLSPDTKYFYKIVGESMDEEKFVSSVREFTTSKNY